MSDAGPRGVLRIGDRVRFDGREQMVVGLAGTTVRLQDDHGGVALVLFAHLMAADNFELLGGRPAGVPLPPFGMLDTVPGPVLARAQLWERHLIEVETGLPPDSAEDARPRPEYDPRWRTLSERVAAKAAELTAIGMPASERTIQRLRACWQEQGLWGLIDGRATRVHSPVGRADERFVTAVVEVLAAQESVSTGTRSRVLRQVQRLLADRHGDGVVPIPARASFYRLVNALAAGQHTFGQATTRRSQARRPQAPFTPTAAARPGEVVQIDTTPLDVLAVWDDGVTGRVELTIAVDVATRTICAAVLIGAGRCQFPERTPVRGQSCRYSEVDRPGRLAGPRPETHGRTLRSQLIAYARPDTLTARAEARRVDLVPGWPPETSRLSGLARPGWTCRC